MRGQRLSMDPELLAVAEDTVAGEETRTQAIKKPPSSGGFFIWLDGEGVLKALHTLF
jgi:hypothetical protein